MTQVPYNATVGLNYAHISNAGTTVVKSSPGLLGTININSGASAAAVTIYDNISATGSVYVGEITLGAAVTAPVQVPFNVNTKTGLTVVTTGTIDMTIGYR